MTRDKRRILVVDDSPLISSIIKDAVSKQSNFECVHALTPEEGIDKLHEFQPHLLVVDVNIGGADGYEFVRHLREEKRWRALPVIMLAEKSAADNMRRAYECGADDLLFKPFDPHGLVLKIKAILRRMSFTYHEATTTLEKKTIRALGRSVEVKDTYTEGHSARVAFYSVIIARALLLPEEQISVLEDAAYLHDLGKIGIHEELLNKPGPLTDEEWAIMKTHPEKSAVIIESLGFMHDMVPMVKYHHERHDGKGYPEGLKARDIPMGARIIAVADSFDAMTSNRAFRAKRDLNYALEEVLKHCGTQFDPEVGELFVQEIQKFPGIENLPNYTSAESFHLLKVFKG